MVRVHTFLPREISAPVAACRNTNDTMVRLLARHTGHNKDKVREDMKRARYFGPYDAVEYNLIDRVLESEEGQVNDRLKALSLGSYEWHLTDPPAEKAQLGDGENGDGEKKEERFVYTRTGSWEDDRVPPI